MLLCTLIPLQGYAYTRLVEIPCPMETMDHHCCNDGDTDQNTKKMCEAGQQCPTGSQYFFHSALKIQMPASFHAVHFSYAAGSPPSFNPSAIWRPPTFI